MEDKSRLAELVEDGVAIASSKEFFKGLMLINGARKVTTKNEFFRAILYALNNKLTDKKIELKSEKEKTLASILIAVLDHRTIMQANLLQRMEKENGLRQEQTNTEINDTQEKG